MIRTRKNRGSRKQNKTTLIKITTEENNNTKNKILLDSHSNGAVYGIIASQPFPLIGYKTQLYIHIHISVHLHA